MGHIKFFVIFLILSMTFATAADNRFDLEQEGMSGVVYQLRDTLSELMFGKDSSKHFMNYETCISWFGGLNQQQNENAKKMRVICGQIMCPKQTQSALAGARSVENLNFGGCSTTEVKKHKMQFYFLYGFMPFIILLYIFKDLLLLFSFLTPRTSNTMAFIMALYSVFLTNGIFNVVIGILDFIGGPFSGMNFTTFFFSFLFMSLIMSFVFDWLFRMMVEVGRVSKAVQYQAYEIAAEQQLGRMRATGGY